MARLKKETGELTVKVADAISDGEGSYLAIGDTFAPVDEHAGEELKAKGLVE